MDKNATAQAVRMETKARRRKLPECDGDRRSDLFAGLVPLRSYGQNLR